MIVNTKSFLILQLILLPLLATSASNVRGRRRPGARREATAVEEVTEKAAGPDQIAIASRTESTRFGMQPSFSSSNQETDNYPYELNLIRPESQFQSNSNGGVSQYNFGNEERQIDDVETAEEYVAKAMQMYGARLQEPIRITAESTQQQNKYDVFETPEPEPQTPAPIISSASVYEKDPVTRSYDVYDYSTYETVSEQQYEPKYESKYRYQPNSNSETAYVAPSMRTQSGETERITAAASSEIPKEEILKQIEKSVIKYMKEMEADGKIIPTAEPKTNYFKIQQTENTQRAQVTPKPKQSSYQYTSTTRNQNQKTPSKQSQSNEESYSSSSLHQELSESLAPNVEFIYKIKARAPLQSMQTSRPTYPNKIPVETFDHSAALKNMEEFDLSHVVQEDRVATKPKLFFNSDIYQDINSLPYKPEKLVISRPHKSKEHPDYKGYSLYTEAKTEDDSEDSGYPIMNPYQFVFKKEPSSSSLVAQSSNWENSHNRPYTSALQKPQLDYDTYSPKFNNNPEGYGYQHQHSQGHKFQGRHPTKRGKRGGPHTHGKKGSRTSIAKDSEANVALRPPPKV